MLMAILLFLVIVGTYSQYVMASSYKAGEYVAEAKGNNGPIKVKVTIGDSKILSVEIIDHSETEGLGGVALKKIADRIIENQSLAVDVVSGATNASKAILTAVEECIKQAGGDIEALKVPVSKINQGKVEKMSTDVVVIGAGPSGLAAAVTAAEGGADVIVLEKTGQIGGTALIGAFGLFAADSRLQKEAGKDVPVDAVYEEWMAYTHWLAEANIVRTFIKKSASTIDWLIDHGMDLVLSPPAQKTHNDEYWTYHAFKDYAKKPQYFNNLLKAAENNGAKFLLETPATDITTNDAGTITGVIAEKKDGTFLEIDARAVIVATGGYGANKEMVKERTDVKMADWNINFTTGDGIKMAWEAGAAAGNSILQLHGFVMPPELLAKIDGEIPELSAILNFATYPWVNSAGRRFANEDVIYDTANMAHVAYAQGEDFFVILSQNMIDTLKAKGARGLGNYDSPSRIAGIPLVADLNKPWTNLEEDLAKAVKVGLAYKGNTLEELALASGMDVKTLIDTIKRYNLLCEKGEDVDLLKEAAHLYPLTEGPYYAVKQRASYLTACGGIEINEKTEALNDDGVPIPGLYAIGNDGSGLYSDTYVLLEGGTLGWAFNSGRMAGENVLNYLSSKY